MLRLISISAVMILSLLGVVCGTTRQKPEGSKPRDEGLSVGPYFEGLAPASIGGKWGFVDEARLWRIQPSFESAGIFREGVAAVRLGGKWGLVDQSGRMVVPARYDWLDWNYAKCGRATFYLAGRAGVLDKTGQEVIAADYNGGGPLCDYALMHTGNRWAGTYVLHVVDFNGRRILGLPITERHGLTYAGVCESDTVFRDGLLFLTVGGEAMIGTLAGIYRVVDKSGRVLDQCNGAPGAPLFDAGVCDAAALVRFRQWRVTAKCEK